MKKALQRFDDSLDICSFLSVRTNLALLISILLSEKQQLLFAYQNKRTISGSKISSDGEEFSL